MKTVKVFVILSAFLFLLCGCENKNNGQNGDNRSTTDFSRTSITKDIEQNTDNNNNDENNKKQPKETELSTFSTPLKSGVANRITNIKITCGKINERVLKPGESFSFNQIVGPCTSQEGYKKAEIYAMAKGELMSES